MDGYNGHSGYTDVHIRAELIKVNASDDCANQNICPTADRVKSIHNTDGLGNKESSAYHIPPDYFTVEMTEIQGHSGVPNEDVTAGGPQFHPPVYCQRYSLIQHILKQHNIHSVVDFGTSECKIVWWFKALECIEHVWLVDVDGKTLKANVARIHPLITDFLIRRNRPLTITALHGSAAHIDRRIIGCQAATLVEVIEHLDPLVLKDVRHCIFAQLRPSLVVVTTPNADFNILFPGLTGFRHWDHKFEWTREEFQTWCKDICKEHAYTVIFTGVGAAPPGQEYLGFCSQVAVFTEAAGRSGIQESELIYTLVDEAVYPVDDQTSQQRLEMEVDYAVRKLATYEQYHSPTDPEYAIIPVAHLTKFINSYKYKWHFADILDHLPSSCKMTDDKESILVSIFQESSSDSDNNTGGVDCDLIRDQPQTEQNMPESDYWC